MAKTVGDLLIKLGVDGLDGVTALKSALRTLGQASKASDKQLEGLRKEIFEVAKAGKVSQQSIRGQIDAFKGLKAQASIGSTVYKRLGKDIDTLTQSLDRLSRKEDEVAKKPATTKQLAVQFTSAIPEKTTRQLQAQQEMLQKSAVSSVEYTQRLVRLNAVTQEFTRSQQRQAVIAGNVVAMNKAAAAQAVSSSKINIENTHTTAALKQKIAELAQDLEHIDVGSKEYITTSNRLKETQEELNQVLGVSSKAFDELSRAQERAERRAAKLAGIQASQAGAIGTRDPRTGAMIAGGSARVSLAQQPVREVSGLYRSISDIGMSKITADIDRMGKSVKEVTRDIKAAAVASNGSVNSLQAQRNAFVQLQAGLDPVSQDFRDLAIEIDKVDRKLGKLGKKRFSMKGAAQTVGAVASAGIFGGAPGLAGALVGAPFGPGGAVIGGGLGASAGVAAEQISSFTNYAASIQLAEKAMERILHVEKNRVQTARRVALANKAIEYAVNKLNVEREDATVGMTRLSAAVLGAGGSIETAALAFLGTTKAIKATKGSADDVRGGLTALVQMFSKGKISAEELSGQLGERFPAAVTAFAEANELSTSELQAMLKNGEVGLDRLVKFLVFVTQKYSDGALQMAASAEESGERQKRSFDEVRRELGKQLIDVGAKLQTGIADSLQTLTPVIVNVAKAVASGIELIINGIVVVIKNFRNLIDVVTVLAGGAVLGSLLTMIGKVSVAMGAKGFAYSVSLLGRFIRFKLVTSVSLLITKLRALAVTMAKNPVTLLALGITALGVSMFRASQRHKDFIDDITNGTMSLEEAGDRVDKYMKRLRDLNKIQEIINESPEAVAGLREAGKTSRKNILDGPAGDVQRLAEGLQDPDLPAISIGTLQGLDEARAITSTQLSGIQAALAGRASQDDGLDIEELLKNLGLNNFETFDGGGSEADKALANRVKAAQALERSQIARLNLAESEGVISRLLAKQLNDREQLSAKITELKKEGTNAEIDRATASALTNQERAEEFELQKAIQKLYEQAKKPIDDIVKRVQDKVRFDKEYKNLLAQGINPEIAQEIINITKAKEAALDKFDAEILILEAKKTASDLNDKELKDIEDQIDALRRKKEAIEGEAAGAIGTVKGTQAETTLMEGLTQAITDQEEALKKLVSPLNQIKSLADAMGEAFQTSFKGLIDGSMTGKEALASFFQSISDHFMDMAAKIAAEAVKLAALKFVQFIIGAMFGGGGEGAATDATTQQSAANAAGWPGNQNYAKGGVFKNGIVPYAKGGIVKKPTLFQYANGGAGNFGLMGEAGAEAILPLKKGPGGKLGVHAFGGGASSIVVNVDASGSSVQGDEDQSKKLGKVIGAAVQAEIVKQKLPGGLLN